jgi:excisionase family DNA binding protein
MSEQAFCMKAKEFVQTGMNVKSLPLNSDPVAKIAYPVPDEIPLTVRQAAVFLGVSPQTVYLWVERKQIPHLRVMGRSIRFLKSDLEPFRATFKQEMGYGTTDKA